MSSTIVRARVAAEEIYDVAAAGPVMGDEELLNFMQNRGAHSMVDAFKLGRLDMAAGLLAGTKFDLPVVIKK